MSKRHSIQEIRSFIIDNLEKYPDSIARVLTDNFGISRQAISRHIRRLIEDDFILSEGNTRNRRYRLKPINKESFNFVVTPDLAEDMVWRNNLSPLLKGISSNVYGICQHGFTEIFNNIIEHSESKNALVELSYYPNKINLVIMDKGVGIFNKITQELGLEDTRHAVLELSKGRLTTDTERHSGEGIFFTTRMFDSFSILSGDIYFNYTQNGDENWALETREEFKGTGVWMTINTASNRTTQKVFDEYAGEEYDYSFTRTHFPVSLVRSGGENLISRSQAKRLLARLEPFKEVLLNFDGIDFIGQAFADEIFRVFKNTNPQINILSINTNDTVRRMINRVVDNSGL